MVMIKSILISLLFFSVLNIQAQHALNFIIPPCPHEVNITEQSVNNKLSVFPNPATDMVTIKFPGTDESQKAKVEIFNILGKKIHEKEFTTDRENNKLIVNISDYQRGTYIIKVRIADKVEHIKLIVE